MKFSCAIIDFRERGWSWRRLSKYYLRVLRRTGWVSRYARSEDTGCCICAGVQRTFQAFLGAVSSSLSSGLQY